MIERIYRCDWRECDFHVRTCSARPSCGVLFVTGGAPQTQHFCSWDCVMKYAAEQEPVEVIEFGGLLGG